MRTVRESMSAEVRYVRADATVLDAARAMADADIGALPVCDDERRLLGIITDRDITVRVVAAGLDPLATAVQDILVEREIVAVGADDELDTAVSMMKRHAVRRVPVLDGPWVIGMLAQADVAEQLEPDETGDMIRTISRAPGNTALPVAGT